MTLKVGGIVLDAANTESLANFWSAATGFPVDFVVEGFAQLKTDGSIGHFFFIKVPEGKTAKSRCHIDYEVDDDREGEVKRLVGLGATEVATHEMDDGFKWTVLQDPEGNEFCVSEKH